MSVNPLTSLKVSEIFYSIQGEGKTAGCPAIFIRLTACNLLCEGSWVCDTIDVWRKGERFTFADLIAKFNEENEHDFYELCASGVHLIFTGGEPLLQQTSIYNFIVESFLLQDRPHPYIEIETNGTIKPGSEISGHVHLWNVSPKLQTSGAKDDARYVPKALEWFARGCSPLEVQFKFVVFDVVGDWNEICMQFLSRFPISNSQIVLMPAASTDSQLYHVSKDVAALCIREKVWFGNRLQVQIWNEVTGV